MQRFLKGSQRAYSEFQNRPQDFMERVIYNYITTHRSIRELASYYRIPKSTMFDWLKKSADLVPYDLYDQYKGVANLHRRAQAMRWNGMEEYTKTYGDGPRD